MIDKKNKKDILNEVVTKELLSSFDDSDISLESFLFKNLKEEWSDVSDKMSLRLLIDNHLLMLKKESQKDIINDNDTLDGVISDFQSLSERRKDVRNAFDNDFYDKSLEVVRDKLSIVYSERTTAIMTYLDNMKDWSNSDIKKIIATGSQQVYYTDMMDRYEDADVKDTFDITDDEGLSGLRRHVNPESNLEPIRFIGEKRISIDFEEFGYHVDLSHPVKEFTDLVDIEQRNEKLKNEYQEIQDKSKGSRSIAFVLVTLCENLEYFYGRDFIQPLIDNGKDVALNLANYAENTGNEAQQAIIMKKIESLVSKGDHKKIISSEVSASLSAVSKSYENIETFVSETRKAKFNSVDMSVIEEETKMFDKNIASAIESHNSSDTLAFKRKYNALNVFEKMSVNLMINEDNANEKNVTEEKTNENTNVFSL